MANKLSTVTETYQGNSIQCAQFVIDTVSSLFRCEPLDVNGDYAFQMVAKADGAKSIQVFVGDKSHTFNLTTSWAFYSFVFEDVTVNNSFLQFKFLSNGTYKLYHSKLEHGNKITDWDESDYDIRSYAEQTAYMLSWIVQSGTSASNFTLTDRTATLVSQFINLHGLVQFGGLDVNAQDLLAINDAEYASCNNDSGASTVYAMLDSGELPSLQDGMYFAVKLALALTNEHNLGWINRDGSSILSAKPLVYNGEYPDPYDWEDNLVIYLRYTVGDITIGSNTYHEYYRMIKVSNNAQSTALSKLAELCDDMDMTIINGGKIATGSIEANKIKANEIFAQHLEMKDLKLSGGSIDIETSSETDDSISLHFTPSGASWSYNMDISPKYYSLYNVLTAGDTEEMELVADNLGFEASLQGDSFSANYGLFGASIEKNNTSYSFLNQYNTMAGKLTSLTVPANGTVTSQIVIPTDRVGFNKPVVTATSNDPDCFAYIAGITTSGNQHTITLGLRNITATALSNKAIHYIITRYDT